MTTAEAGYEAVAVKGEMVINGSARTRAEAADYGAYFTVTVPASAFSQQILPYDENRKMAYVLATGTGPVFLGSQGQITSGVAGQGFQLPVNVPYPITHKQAVWLGGDGSHSATVSVSVERFESPMLPDARPGVPGVAEEL